MQFPTHHTSQFNKYGEIRFVDFIFLYFNKALSINTTIKEEFRTYYKCRWINKN
jgi:hypothetical protein